MNAAQLLELIAVHGKTVACKERYLKRVGNPKREFRELELIEKYGSGVRRVIDAFVAHGLPEPEFEATQGGMAVTVFKNRVIENTPPQPESRPESDLPMAVRVLKLLAKAPMSKRDISAALGQKEISGQLNKVIRAMVASGQIAATLSDKPNSRLQQYRLTVNHNAQPAP